MNNNRELEELKEIITLTSLNYCNGNVNEDYLLNKKDGNECDKNTTDEFNTIEITLELNPKIHNPASQNNNLDNTIKLLLEFFRSMDRETITASDDKDGRLQKAS